MCEGVKWMAALLVTAKDATLPLLQVSGGRYILVAKLPEPVLHL